MLSGFDVNCSGAGKGVFVGGGKIGVNSLRWPGTGGIADSAFFRSSRAFFALISVGVFGVAIGFGAISDFFGKDSCRRFKRGPKKGFASTLAMKIAASAVIITPNAR